MIQPQGFCTEMFNISKCNFSNCILYLCPFQKDFCVVFNFSDGQNVKVLGYFGDPVISFVPHLNSKG
jgi:hypothetical protein